MATYTEVLEGLPSAKYSYHFDESTAGGSTLTVVDAMGNYDRTYMACEGQSNPSSIPGIEWECRLRADLAQYIGAQYNSTIPAQEQYSTFIMTPRFDTEQTQYARQTMCSIAGPSTNDYFKMSLRSDGGFRVHSRKDGVFNTVYDTDPNIIVYGEEQLLIFSNDPTNGWEFRIGRSDGTAELVTLNYASGSGNPVDQWADKFSDATEMSWGAWRRSSSLEPMNGFLSSGAVLSSAITQTEADELTKAFYGIEPVTSVKNIWAGTGTQALQGECLGIGLSSGPISNCPIGGDPGEGIPDLPGQEVSYIARYKASNYDEYTIDTYYGGSVEEFLKVSTNWPDAVFGPYANYGNYKWFLDEDNEKYISTSTIDPAGVPEVMPVGYNHPESLTSVSMAGDLFFVQVESETFSKTGILYGYLLYDTNGDLIQGPR